MTAPPLSDAELDRYARQIILPGFGGAGQARVRQSHVALIGAGGIGCPAISALAAAGVGTLTIIDHDVVERSNLHRQPLFSDADIGASKAEVAAAAARRINPHVTATARPVRLDAANAPSLLTGADLILDGCDRFATRRTVNAAAVALGIPLLSAAVTGFAGQVALFDPRAAGQPCYQCLVGDADDAPGESCAEAGVLGPVAATVGALAATEALRHLAGTGDPLTGHLILADMMARRWRTVRIAQDPECPVCRR